MVLRALSLGLTTLFLAADSQGPHGPQVAPAVEHLLGQPGQPRLKVWIEFCDKGFADSAARDAALAEVAARYPRRAVERRRARRRFEQLFDPRDLPVAPTHVERVRALGIDIHVRARWLNAISATIDAAQLAALRRLPFVRRIEPVRAGHRRRPAAATAAVTAGDAAAFHGMAQPQLDMIGLPALHAQGFTGQGVVIGVLDTGFLLTHDAFTQPAHPIQVLAAWDFVNNDPDVGPEPGDPPNQHDHGTMVLGAMAAYLPNTLVGAAYDAAFVLAKTEDTSGENPIEEDYYVAGLQFVEQNGADVATSSLGYIAFYAQSDLDGRTAKSTLAVNVATGNGVFCCTAAGNGGNDLDPTTSSLIPPADAFDVLTCGAVLPTLEIASFSSDGPTADGRVKPELMTQGDIVYTVSPSDDTALATASGTSMATPLLAGAVACLAQAGPGYDVATMRERLIRSASYFGSPQPDPLYVYGWGIPNAATAFALAGTWSDLGGGVPGTAGTPVLTGSGPLLGTEPVRLDLTGTLPNSPVILVLGVTRIDAPLFGGVFVPSPDLALGLTSDPNGALTLTFPWAAGLPSGFGLYSQVWLADGAAPFGLAASNGLAAVTP